MKKNHQTVEQSNQNGPKVRLDKWLWAARFFKTRALATEAVKGGKVHVNDARIKPSHIIKTGEIVRIRKQHQEQTIIVDAISENRGSAPIAQTMYHESTESIKKREAMSKNRRDLYLANPTPDKRPNKQQRRNIIKFKQDRNFD